MPYCRKCGSFNNEDAKYCIQCGDALTGSDRFEWAGKVLKCPACGCVLETFMVTCPSCGHEIRQEIEESFQKFVLTISACDKVITADPRNESTGWAGWTTWQRILWVILNVYTLGIPALCGFLKKISGFNRAYSLTAQEKQKVAIIENYTFPNNYETLLEVLIYIKSKILIIASGKIDPEAAYWSKLWTVKADQVYQKIVLLSKGNTFAAETYNCIIAENKKIQKKAHRQYSQFRAILLFGLILLIIWIASCTANDKKNNEVNHQETTAVTEATAGSKVHNSPDVAEVHSNDIELGDYTASIPSYWTLIKNETNTKSFEAETGNSYAYLSIEIIPIGAVADDTVLDEIINEISKSLATDEKWKVNHESEHYYTTTPSGISVCGADTSLIMESINLGAEVRTCAFFSPDNLSVYVVLLLVTDNVNKGLDIYLNDYNAIVNSIC